jgi:acetylornithine deacetylase/succinyl-diaminopimelate desuccinylase-like protein
VNWLNIASTDSGDRGAASRRATVENGRLASRAARLSEALAELVAIRSVSPDPACAGEVARAADWAAERIRRIGGDATVSAAVGALPLVVGEVAASSSPGSAPDVLVYAHVDVQSAGPLDAWGSPPFELTRRDGQLYGRGVADDKANVVILLAAVEELAAAGDLPVNVRFLIDAEEEVAGDSADRWLLADERGAAVAVMLDGSVDELTTGIRGVMYGSVGVTTGTTGQHAGLYGGAALPAIDALIRALGALLPGSDGRLPDALRAGATPASDTERTSWGRLPSGAELLDEAGLRPADATAGRDFHERTRAEPALTITGIGAGDVALLSPVIPVEAKAAVMLRPVAGQSAAALAAEVERLLREACPAGGVVDVSWEMLFDGVATDGDAPELRLAADAIERCVGIRPAAVRTGGSLPLFENLCLRGIPVVCTGFGIEREANMHGSNERFPEAHLERGTEAMLQILTGLGSRS